MIYPRKQFYASDPWFEEKYRNPLVTTYCWSQCIFILRWFYYS